MAEIRTQTQMLGGQQPGDALRLSAPTSNLRLLAANAAPAAAEEPTAGADPAMRLLQYKDELSLTPAPATPAPAAPATARVQALGPLARARAQQAAATTSLATPPVATPVATPAPAPAAPAPAAPTLPAAAPAATTGFVPATAAAQVAQPIAQATDADAAFKAAEQLLIDELMKRHAQPDPDQERKLSPWQDQKKAEPAKEDPAVSPWADKPKQDETSADDKIKPWKEQTPPEQPKQPDAPASDPKDAAKLKDLSPAELARLGREDKAGFFAALRPAAEEAERKYGVPAAITLAQAALETGWAQHIIPGYNIFGIKGTGPAGTTKQGTWEVYDGKKVTISANFAKYNNFYEAVELHGKLFHNGYYDKAINAYAKDHDVFNFAKNITGVYATDPSYGSKLSSIIRQYHLV